MGIHALQVSESSRCGVAGRYFNLALWNSYCFTDPLTGARQISDLAELRLPWNLPRKGRMPQEGHIWIITLST